jgi:hypothetical protein
LPRGYYRHLTEQEIAFLKMSKWKNGFLSACLS